MAEAYLSCFSNSEVEVYSAGIEKHGLNLMAVNVMLEDGIDISNHTSNKIDDFIHLKFDYIITVCDNAMEKCPYFPGDAIRIHNSFPDPASTIGDKDYIKAEFVKVRDQIKQFCTEFIKKYKP
jgi:arsenate reductase